VKVYNVSKLHRPLISHGLLVECRYESIITVVQQMRCSVKCMINERAEKD